MSAPGSIASLGTILCIGAHPDDETFIAGGILTAAAQNGQTVVCVTATKGEAGSQDVQKWPLEQIDQIRAAELKNALEVLGVTKHHWLGYRDGQCHQADTSQAVAKLTTLIEQYHPNTILTFGPDGLTGHHDHAQVSAWVTQAVQHASHSIKVLHCVTLRSQYDQYLQPMDAQLNIFFNIAEPRLVEPQDCGFYFELSPSLQERKYRALQQMPSQMITMLERFEPDFVQRAFSIEAFVAA